MPPITPIDSGETGTGLRMWINSETMIATGTITNIAAVIRTPMLLAAVLPVSKLRLPRLMPAVKLKTKWAALNPVRKSPQNKLCYFRLT